MFNRSLITLAIAAALVAPAAHAQSETRKGLVFTGPNLTTGTVAKDVPFMGSTFTNQGLVAVGRVPATQLDGLGQSLGSMSDMVIDLTHWRRNGDTYTGGVLIALPDRGYNAGDVYSDYAARLQRYAITLKPDYGTGTAPADTLKLDFQGTQVLKDNTGKTFTGLDSATGVGTALGAKVPVVQTGVAAGKIALDAEGLAYRNDGSFYISDEYAAGIYYFDKTGTLTGIIQAPPALMPMTGGTLNFNSLKSPDVGRNANQGLEGLAITPDNTRLASLLQSSAFQDGGDKKPVTRLMIYDISKSATPQLPAEHYAFVLPTINGKTAAQSSMLALNNTQFLVLARDGAGLGNGNGLSDGGTYGFKSILLVDTAGATNLAGTPYESSYTPVAPGGALLPTITPVWQAEFVNLLNPDQLARFGMNLNANKKQDVNSVSSKWEALGIAPVLDAAKPNDWFLFTGNDNDFQTTNCTMPLMPNGAVVPGNCAGTFNNDQRVLVYRLTLPTYLSPVYLQAMQVLGTQRISSLQAVGAQGVLGLGDTVNSYVSNEWMRVGQGMQDGVRVYADGSYRHLEWRGRGQFEGTLGAEFPLGGIARAGVHLMAGSSHYEDDFGQVKTRPTGIAAHVRFAGNQWAAKLMGAQVRTRFNDVQRRDVFGMTASGSTRGSSRQLGAEIGYTGWHNGQMRLMPFVGYELLDERIDGYTETGAAGGDIVYGDSRQRANRARVGLQWGAGLAEGSRWHPSVRASYARAFNQRDSQTRLSLAHATNAGATVLVSPGQVFGNSLDLQGQLGYDITPNSTVSFGAGASRVRGFTTWGSNLRYTLGF